MTYGIGLIHFSGRSSTYSQDEDTSSGIHPGVSLRYHSDTENYVNQGDG